MDPIDNPNSFHKTISIVDPNLEKSLDILQNLPKLKSTINISYAGIDFWHDKVWILSDKITNKYYYLGKLEYEIISRWDLGKADEIIAAVNTQTIHKIEVNNIDTLFKFLLGCNLLQVSSTILKSLEKSKKNKFLTTLTYAAQVFSYKVPLVNPDKFLDKTLEIGRVIFSPYFFYFILMLFFLNLYLLSSNWGSFAASLPSFNSLTSILLILFTIGFTKIIHELGHAYASKMYNCSVPEVGVNFIFFYPLFYTDVTDTITLKPKQRLVVSTAGIRFELYLAIIAGYFWFLLPDNTILKNMMFFIAAISWTLSLLINIVPFLKFDGYYIFSDYMKIRNLAPRAFAVLKYNFRKYFIGLDTALPEQYDYSKFRFLLVFAILMAAYRILILSSILLFLYYIELIGELLFIFAIAMLLIVPVAKECYNLWLLRSKFTANPNIITFGIVLFVFFVSAFVPMNNYVYLPAVFHAKTQRIFTPFVAKVEKIDITIGQQVQVDQALVKLASLELNARDKINKYNLEAVKQAATEVQLSEKDHSKAETKIADIDYQKTIAENIAAKSEQLQIKSPINGRVTAMYEGVYQSQWLSEKAWLLDVVDLSQQSVDAFARGQDLLAIEKIGPKTEIAFIPDQINYPPCKVKFKSVATDPIHSIQGEPSVLLTLAKSELLNSSLLIFASNYGGYINFNIDEKNNLVPIDAYFTVDLIASNQCDKYGDKIIKGVVKIKGNDKSVAYATYQKITRMFLRHG